ncbi:hypothetical protein OESDEN_08697 [Oesophagostomum dentatum]|uniref:Uncharacterized protein n=1 Tax=Oesophagostomum dentatum TaxID=61180 RepID=A0A0B1T1K3_OESDE|nr:hypothetical protein OESDEN_08697 [Oesophagostomum dentatum]
MLACLRHASKVPLVHRYGASCVSVRNCYDPRNRISGAYNPNLRRKASSIALQGNPLFMTRAAFDEQMKLIRAQDVGSDYGVKATPIQRYLLLATKMYKTFDDIPRYVRSGTMNRMHDRMRILGTSLAALGFFVLFYHCHRANVGRVMRDRDAGRKIHS